MKLRKILESKWTLYIVLFLYLVLMVVLSQFRDMVRDESLYFHETWLLSELIKNGQWFGNYGVGLHGFLFKLPPALLFLITGPSVDLVTVYSVLLAVANGFLFYKILEILFKRKDIALMGVFLLFSSFHFVLSVPTYLREIPSLFVILLFFYAYLKKLPKWSFAIFFILLLDVKEYVFFVFALAYVIVLFFETKEKNIFKRIWIVVKECLLVFVPSLLWIVLMMFTGIIPVNMFLASIIGLLNLDFIYVKVHFNVEYATTNLIDGGATLGDVSDIAIVDTWCRSSVFMGELCNILDIVVGYVSKMLYPRSFSFISIPKVIVMPALLMGFHFARQYFVKNKKKFQYFAVLSVYLFLWMLVYIARVSHGRYLLPVSMIFFVFFLYFLFAEDLSKKLIRNTLILTIAFMALGFLFESSYLAEKILLEMLIFAALLVSKLVVRKNWLKYLITTVTAGSCFGVALLFSYTSGQIAGYLDYGENRDVAEISEVIPEEGRYWMNNEVNPLLFSVYIEEKYSNPEWQFSLRNDLPKKNLLTTLGEQRTYNFAFINSTVFKSNLELNNIHEIVVLDYIVDEGNNEYLLSSLNGDDAFVLADEFEFDYATVYIYEFK